MKLRKQNEEREKIHAEVLRNLLVIYFLLCSLTSWVGN